MFWLTFALTIDGAMAAGYNVNALELSPNYAGSIRGMASTIANIQVRTHNSSRVNISSN